MAVFPDANLPVQWTAGPPYELIDSIKMTARVDAQFNLLVPRVLDTGWFTLALSSGWSNEGSGFANAEYRLKGGVVYFHGMITGGTTGTLFTVLAGFRPLATTSFTVLTSGGTGRIDVISAGVVSLVQFNNSSTNSYMSLDNIRYIAEQ